MIGFTSVCVPGEYRELDGWCMLCDMESYKNDTGDHACTPCPVGMTTMNNGSTECGASIFYH